MARFCTTDRLPTARTWLALASFALCACDDDRQRTPAPQPGACMPGDTSACTGPEECEGTRTCRGSPPSWRACACDDAPSRDAGGDPRLGAECEEDGDCPDAAFCLDASSSEYFGGGPPAGTCVARCDEPDACDSFEDAVCVNVGVAAAGDRTVAFCFERCSLGSGGDVKCHARPGVACAPIEPAATDAFCRPLCASDEDCLEGVCDPRHGVCVADTPPDRNFGLLCDVELDPAEADAGSAPGTADPCAGLCVQLNDAPTVCSRRCVFGEPGECAPASLGQRRGACAFATEGGGIGDLGYCAELCDCGEDCAEPTFVCDAFDDASLEAAFGRKGVCTDPELAINQALDCEP